MSEISDDPRIVHVERPRIAAVAFDLDGLIFDTEALFFRVASEMMADRGKSFTAEMMAAMIGKQAVLAYPALKRIADLPESPEELHAEAKRRFYELIDTAVHPMPGLFVMVQAVERRKLPRAVCTSSRRAYAERLLHQHGLLPHFPLLLAAEDVAQSKPNPEIYLTAARKLGVEPAALLVLEDSPAGIAAGAAAGAYTVGIPHEHSPASAYQGANLIAERLDDVRLLALLGDA